MDSPAKALAIDQLQPMLQSRLESKGVAWNAALLRDVSLEMLHSCLQSADVRPSWNLFSKHWTSRTRSGRRATR